MPNWRKLEDYAFTERLGRDGWAWEFLRRNPEYRQDWKSALLEAGIDEAEVSARDFFLRDRECARKWCRDNLINPNINLPVFLPFSQRVEHRPDLRSAVQVNEKIHPFASLYTEIFNLALPLGAQLEEVHKRLVHEQEWLRLIGIAVSLRERRARPLAATFVEPEAVAIVFDLTHSIRQQMKAAHRILSKYRVEIPVKRPQRANWQRYLRLLDAIGEGATNKEIGEVLFPECRDNPRHRDIRVRDAKRAALFMRSEGFRHILRLPFDAPPSKSE